MVSNDCKEKCRDFGMLVENIICILIPSSVVELGWGLFDDCSDNLVVYCDEGSEIHAYCERNKIKNVRTEKELVDYICNESKIILCIQEPYADNANDIEYSKI